MANWGTESTNDASSNDNVQWKVKTKFVDDTLRKLKQEADNQTQKFTWVKANKGSCDGFQNWIHSTYKTCQELTNNVEALNRLLPKDNDFEYVAKSNQVKQLTKRVEIQVKHIQNLCTEIQKELQSRYIENKNAANESGDRTSVASSNSIQLQRMEEDNTQLDKAREESEKMQQIATDIIELESMFVKMSSMVNEQKDFVNHIDANVEEVYVKTDEANKELGTAVKFKYSATKKKLILILIALLVVAIIIVAIVLGVKYG